jgi:predicted transcriptional regulator
MRFEEPTWDGPFVGSFGVLVDDGDKVQCLVCGEWFAHLGSHTNHSQCLTADEYRQGFGLM